MTSAMPLPLGLLVLAGFSLVVQSSPAAVFNLKVLTDASPDYSDMDSLVHSVTSRWQTPEEKCWAMFYWLHIARRQTAPMELHGMALTDPIRQFNDYGFTMCSTIAGINCSIWDAMGFRAKYWDISLHTVPEVEYGGRWHMYDNSMSALYTLCDGRTLAGVADIGQSAACAASGGVIEPGHIAKYHCLMATSPKGFLTGADTIRSVEEEAHCFNTNGLKYRHYFYDWDRGHRYILNLRAGEDYTRFYHTLGKGPEYYVPNHGKDPEAANPRYRIRGNGRRVFTPELSPAGIARSAHQLAGVQALADGGLQPSAPDQRGQAIFKIEGANVITALTIRGRFLRQSSADLNSIEFSTCNGLRWDKAWENTRTGETPLELKLLTEVNGAYEVLVRVNLLGKGRPADAILRKLEFETFTMLNSKTQPRLNLGRNLVYVGAGSQTESIVCWPDLQGNNAKPWIIEQKNMTSASTHPGYMGVMHAVDPKEEASVVFRIDAPRDVTALTYGGRLYNRAPRSRITFSHSFDNGRSWTESYTLTNTAPPWDVIHYESVRSVPPGTHSVLCRFTLNSSQAGKDACSIYALRMEANHLSADTRLDPLDVTFNWSERQPDYTLVERSKVERVTSLPHRFTLDVRGVDHPVMNFLRIASVVPGTPAPSPKAAATDLADQAQKFSPTWVTYGKNLALGKSYTLSEPSATSWGAGDPDGRKLTDGVVGPPYPGGIAPRSGACWNKGQKPEITVDLGRVEHCGAFRIQVGAGWPWWDSLKGEVEDKVELLTSTDGRDFQSRGFFNFNLRWKDLSANHFWPDEESLCGHLFELIPPATVDGRYVRFRITPARTLTVSEVQVLDFIRYEPFDLRIAMPE